MARVVIIGAGLTGLSTAYHLEQKGFYDYLLLERKSGVGGLCGSVEQDGFTFDYTGHLLHVNDSYFKHFIKTVVGFDFFNTIDRRSYIYSHERYTHYPYQINLHGLPEETIVECIQGFVERVHNPAPRTFREWVQAEFGNGFARHFFIPYQEKIFDCSVDEITASWTSRFVPQTTLGEIIRGILHKPDNTIGYNAQFLYPKSGGIVSWVRKVAEALIRPIQYNSIVKKVDLNTRTIQLSDGHTEQFDELISTMPLNALLQLLVEKPTMDCIQAAHKLRCNSVYNINLGIQKPDLSDKHWIYFPELQYPFYRIGFPHNFSTSAVPKDCSSLYAEIAFMPEKQPHYQKLTRNVKSQLRTLLNFSDDHIVSEKNMIIPHAYVTFDHWREKNLSALLARLAQEKVYSIGRYGAWKYASMQEAVLDGKKIADQLIVTSTLQGLQKPKITDDNQYHTVRTHMCEKEYE